MNLKTAQNIRRAAGYQPGSPVEYEPPRMHHFGEMPKYETHERLIRSWDPKRQKIMTKTVTKIIMAPDGRTPRSPKLTFLKREVAGKPEGEQIIRPVTELIPIGAPVRLKKGSPKAIYRLLKKIEQSVGLDSYYARLAKEAV